VADIRRITTLWPLLNNITPCGGVGHPPTFHTFSTFILKALGSRLLRILLNYEIGKEGE